MTVKKLYEILIKEGIKADLRKPSQIREQLRKVKKQFQQLRPLRRSFFDLENLTNPYSDTRVLYGNPDAPVECVMVGIDIEPGDLAVVEQLKQRGQAIDLVLAHHPEGIALAGLDEVMHLQTDILINLGVSPRIAEEFMKTRMEEVNRKLHAINHMRVVDAARLLDMPLMCCHTPADNHVATYLQKLVDKSKPRTLENILDLLLREPEYRDAAKMQAGPKILIGKSNDKAGRIFVDMTGGTEGPDAVFGRLSQLGIDTVLGMHFSEAHFKKMKSEQINVVNAGHIASDNLGMNLILDKVERYKKLTVIECSGFRRFRR